MFEPYAVVAAITVYWFLLPWLISRRRKSRVDFLIELPWYLVFLLFIVVGSLLRGTSLACENLYSWLHAKFIKLNKAIEGRYLEDDYPRQ